MKTRCPDCASSTVNGVFIHEKGCPSEWKDIKRQCRECGDAFCPEDKAQTFCSEECYRDYNGLGSLSEPGEEPVPNALKFSDVSSAARSRKHLRDLMDKAIEIRKEFEKELRELRRLESVIIKGLSIDKENPATFVRNDEVYSVRDVFNSSEDEDEQDDTDSVDIVLRMPLPKVEVIITKARSSL